MHRTALERRRRTAARVALYGSLAVLTAAALALLPLLRRVVPMRPEEQWGSADYPNLPAVRLLQEYVRIDTSATGSELAGARFLAGRLAAGGIEATIEDLGNGRANLWAIIEGEDPGALVLHHHIDVSPVGDPAKWAYPPFSAHIELPWIFGRGVFDMKSLAIAHLEALLHLKAKLDAQGRRPRRSVILLATSSEETGSRLGTRWILARHPELARRFWAVLTEGGVVEAVSRREIKYWGIEFGQKRFAAGEACHAERGRLEDLEKDIALTGGTAACSRVLTPEVASFFTAYAGSRQRPSYRDALTDPESVVHLAGRFRSLPNYLKSLFCDEVVPLGVREDSAGGFRLPLVVHLLPHSALEPVLERALPAWTVQGVAVRVEEPLGADAASPLDHPVFTALAAAVRARYPGAPAGPYFLPWSATDARFFRKAGIPAYGFSPFLILSTDTVWVDAPDERISLPGFVDGVQFFTETLERLVT